MTNNTLIQNLIWITNPLILLTCALVLYRRRQGRDFKFFVLYLLFVSVQAAIAYLLGLRWPRGTYVSFYSYWTMTSISIGLSFAALYELISHILTSGSLKITRSRFIFIVSALFLVAALIGALTAQTSSRDPALVKTVLITLSILRAVQVGLLLILAALTVFFGFYWGNQAFGVAAGFGLYAVMSIVNTYIRRRLGPNGGAHFYAVSDVVSYQAASLLWLFYAFKSKDKNSKGKSDGTESGKMPKDQLSDWQDPVQQMLK